MSKITLRGVKNQYDEAELNSKYRELGKIIIKAWSDAIEDNNEHPVIDRNKLIKELSPLLDRNSGNGRKTIEFDVVFDTDLDDHTRLVWLAIPIPDVREGSTGKKAWSEWLDENYISVPDDKKAEQEEKFGKSVLFGCGR
jgi:hypothetical protein